MMKRYATIIFLISAAAVQAQSYLTYSGARSNSMSDASVATADVFAAFNNQAALTQLEKPEAGIAVLNRFTTKELNTQALAFAMPLSKNKGTFAISANQFGYNLFNRKKIGLAYAKKLSNVFSAGVQVDYLNTKIAEGYGGKSSFTVEAGMLARINDKLKFGLHIFNPLHVQLADFDNERIPVILKAGLNYQLAEKVITAFEVSKIIDQKPSYKVGLEYHPVPVLYLRGGIISEPSQFTFGIGLKFSDFYFDISSGYFKPLGYSPSVGLRYVFN
jgi:hypothetical protein